MKYLTVSLLVLSVLYLTKAATIEIESTDVTVIKIETDEGEGEHQLGKFFCAACFFFNMSLFLSVVRLECSFFRLEIYRMF